MPLTHICCPNCHSRLGPPKPETSVYTCPTCAAEYLQRGGVIDFLPEDDFFDDEVGRGTMNLILDRAEQGDWFVAIREHAAAKAGLVNLIIDPGRLGWLFHCYDEQATNVCLEIGSNWGGLSFALNRFYQTVYSVDRGFEKLRFQALRSDAEGINNIHFIRSNLLKLPLLADTVDLVVLNGILEQIGRMDQARKAEESQLHLLREVRRVLKSTGTIYLGVENRLGIVQRFFKGQIERDSSSNKFQEGHCPRSIWGYEAMLKEAGFLKLSSHWTWPHYNYPRMTGPLDGKSVKHLAKNLQNHLDRRWLRFLVGLGLSLPDWAMGLFIKTFSSYFLIVASQETNQTLQTRITQRDPNSKSFVSLATGPNEVKNTFLLLDDEGVSKSVRAVEQAPSSNGKSRFTCRETKGINGRLIRPYQQDEVKLAASWLADFHAKTNTGTWPTVTLEEEISYLVEIAEGYFGHKKDFSSLLTRFAATYSLTVRATSLPLVTEHGDYTIPNIMVAPEGSLCVIDWEHSRQSGNPLLDVGAFCLSLLRRSLVQGSFLHQLPRYHPSYWFLKKYYGSDSFSPGYVAPGYYLLRLITRISTNVDYDEPTAYFARSRWVPLLGPALEYGLRMADGEW